MLRVERRWIHLYYSFVLFTSAHLGYGMICVLLLWVIISVRMRVQQMNGDTQRMLRAALWSGIGGERGHVNAKKKELSCEECFLHMLWKR